MWSRYDGRATATRMATMATVMTTSINVKPRARAVLCIFRPRPVFGASARALRDAANRRSAQADRWSKAEGSVPPDEMAVRFFHGDDSRVHGPPCGDDSLETLTPPGGDQCMRDA